MRPASDRLRPFVPRLHAPVRPVPSGLAGVVWHYFARSAWTNERANARGWRGVYWRSVRVTYLAVSGFLSDHCFSRSAALTYTTVLSLVPLLALSFAVAKGFGFYETLLQNTINPFLDETFGPLGTPQDFVHGPQNFVVAERSHAVRMALAQVLEFVQRTDVSALGWLGLALLVFTVIKVISSIEATFNEIWGAQSSRRWIRKLTDYLAMLVVTPLFLFVAAGMTAAAKTSGVFLWITGQEPLREVVTTGLRLAPLLFLWAGFTVVYMVLPNARTRLSSAILGALVGGTLWQVTLLVHLDFQIGIARYNAIYSGFAALPVFLMWINFSWGAVLLGAEICNAHQSEPSCSAGTDVQEEAQAFREALAMRCLGRISESFLSGAPPWSAERLAQDLSLRRRPVGEVLGELAERDILCMAQSAGENTFLPARDLETIRVKDVLDALRGQGGFEPGSSSAAVDEVIERSLTGLERDQHDSHHNRTLRSLAESALRARAEAAGQVQAAGAAGAAGTGALTPATPS